MKKYICEVCNQSFDNQLEFAKHCVQCHKQREKELLEARRVKHEERINDLYIKLEEAVKSYRKNYPSNRLCIHGKFGQPILADTLIKNLFTSFGRYL